MYISDSLLVICMSKYHAEVNQGKAGVATPSDKVDFGAKNLQKTDKDIIQW